jgi:hypothetical protein
MTMGGKNALVTDAKLLRLDIYPDTVACVDNDVPPGSVPIVSHTFKPGDEIKLDIPPGKRTLVLTTYADDSGSVVTGTGCTTAILKPGAQMCVNLTVAPAPDLSVIHDLTAVDVAACQGNDCPCETTPDNCPAGQFCDPASSRCEVGCKQASDCAGIGPAHDGGMPRTLCNTSSHTCVECLANGDCPLGKLCSPSGVCTIGCDVSHACPGGLACCNSLCVDTTSDPAHCGMCNNPCNVGNATTCCASQCADLNTSADHCGSCGFACSGGNVAVRHCSAGKCAPECNFGRGDCNPLTANDGCETDITTSTNCGGCAVACDATPAKNSAPATCFNVPDGGAATCKYTCKAPFDDCNLAAPDTNGCETNLNNDTGNCGACMNACDNTNNTGTFCNSGTCGHASCNLHLADCNTSQSHNQDECETTATDVNSACGSCSACLSGGIITTRTCNVPGGSSAFCSYTCDGCTDTGASGHSCDGTKCSYTCTAGNVDCNAGSTPNTDGCCPTSTTPPDGGCCATTCEIQHTTGLTNGKLVGATAQAESQRYFTCDGPRASPAPLWDGAHGIRACLAWLGGPVGIGSGTCVQYTCALGSTAVCATKNPGDAANVQCACWVLTGSNMGKAFIDSDVNCQSCSFPGSDWN